MSQELPKPPIKKKPFSATLGKTFSATLKIVTLIFAVAGFGLISSYVAVYMHWTNTDGIIDRQSDAFWKNSRIVAALSVSNIGATEDIFFNKQNFCLLETVKSSYPGEFRRVIDLALDGKKDLAQKNLDSLIITLDVPSNKILSAIKNSCENNSKFKSVTKKNFEELADMVDSESPFTWANSDEWAFFKESILKDKDVLKKVELETGIKSRVLVSQLMAEQMRLFYSDRPWFKKAIEPLKVLGSMTQFSWGIFGVKPETAAEIENNLKDEKSPFYLGADYQKLLDFKTENVQQERFSRITDYKDHYYSCLYAALYNKQIISQWKNSGFDISSRPEILATLFNIGFAHSKPGADPQVGGSELQIDGEDYSFGRLAYEFYYSGELLSDFPQ